MSGARVTERPRRPMVYAVPDREVELTVTFHLIGAVERSEHVFRHAKVGLWQCAGPQGVRHRDRQERSADTVPADVEEIDREVLGVYPVVAERVSAELRTGNEAPVHRH